ncbi:MAG: (2Fe-2S) ferredoxin domain-containing protein [Alphaproteobacteria bacterium]|jgi:(2Fe-2S) ferredoxin|nr:(2Fe-2S) ferredoxin domain-containing protein [Alphaproteobacteria bacterium]CAA6606314.1 Ferredoxin, 2Fe-2S [Rhodospirillaceae bacterium LM-1]
MNSNVSNKLAEHFRAHLFMCTNRRPDGHPTSSCAERGAQDMAEAARKIFKEMNLEKTRFNYAGCLGRCGQGPVLVIYPEGVWYSVKTSADIEEILSLHLREGKLVERLLTSVEAPQV